jgi:hypothetical protein
VRGEVDNRVKNGRHVAEDTVVKNLSLGSITCRFTSFK